MADSTEIFTVGYEGVEMRSDPLLVPNGKAVHARNLSFDEGRIESRPSFRYKDLGVKGQFQGACHFTPRFGLSSQVYSDSPSALSVVAGSSLYLIPSRKEGLGEACEISGAPLTGDTFLLPAEEYLIVLDDKGSYWWEGGLSLTTSKGSSGESDGSSHDTFIESEHKHYIPHESYSGVYVNSRVSVAVEVKGGSEIWSSDIIGKRGFVGYSKDLLLMEEQVNGSFGDPLTAGTRLGATVSMQIMPEQGRDGDGLIYDFREHGIVTHDTFDFPRETRYGFGDNEEPIVIQQGWDTRRQTNTIIIGVSAASRYASYRLPRDILFRSPYGLHSMKMILGEGTLNDITTNHLSHDVEPIMRFDTDLNGCAVGHWLDGSRFFVTVGLQALESVSSSQSARGFVSFNQAARFSEDRTPYSVWEGVWTIDDGMFGVHCFVDAGDAPTQERYGFLSSKKSGDIFYGEFDKEKTGLDYRDGEEIPIDWEIHSRAYAFRGLDITSVLAGGQVELELDESSEGVSVDILTDQCQEWIECLSVDCEVCEPSIVKSGMSLPPEEVREATWFQFRVRGRGYVNIRRLTVDHKKGSRSSDGFDACVPLKKQQTNYFGH